MCSLEKWIREVDWRLIVACFQGLLTPVIAGIAVYIARQQWKTAAYRVKFDLYDRRIRVYERVREILGLMYTTVSDDARLHELLRDTRDAEFLFGSEIKNYIEEVFQRASALSSAHQHLREILNTAPPEQRRVLAEREQEQVQWAFAEARTIADRFKSALDVSKL